MSDYLYFDHAAATTVRPEAWEALNALKNKPLGNPSSVHTLGRNARGLIDQARISLAPHFLAKPEELIFTSGATESLHLAIIGSYLNRPNKRGVVFVSPLVHHCVWAALDFLTNQKQVTVKFLPLTKRGHLDLEKITDHLIGEADMIITEHLNSEIGVLQPAAKLGKKLIRWAEETGKTKPIYIVDAAASAVTENVGLEFQKCDLLVLSGEKIGGISGTGLLLKSKALDIEPLVGGTQEWGWRGGTENVAGIAALNAAYQKNRADLETQNQRLTEFKTQIIEIIKNLGLKITTPQEGSGLHILHFLLPGSQASLFVTQADISGLALSAGSACSSGTIEGSKVLLNLGYDDENAQQGVRISWGWDTTQQQVDCLGDRLKSLL